MRGEAKGDVVGDSFTTTHVPTSDSATPPRNEDDTLRHVVDEDRPIAGKALPIPDKDKPTALANDPVKSWPSVFLPQHLTWPARDPPNTAHTW